MSSAASFVPAANARDREEAEMVSLGRSAIKGRMRRGRARRCRIQHFYSFCASASRKRRHALLSLKENGRCARNEMHSAVMDGVNGRDPARRRFLVANLERAGASGDERGEERGELGQAMSAARPRRPRWLVITTARSSFCPREVSPGRRTIFTHDVCKWSAPAVSYKKIRVRV